jgi:hypothetical protein
MLRTTLAFALKFLFIFAVLYGMYWLVDSAFPVLATDLLASLFSPSVIVLLTIATACYGWARNAILKQL